MAIHETPLAGIGTDYLTTDEVATKLRTNPETVRYWRHIGKGPAFFKAGKRVLYDATDLDAWITALKQTGGAAT